MKKHCSVLIFYSLFLVTRIFVNYSKYFNNNVTVLINFEK